MLYKPRRCRVMSVILRVLLVVINYVGGVAGACMLLTGGWILVFMAIYVSWLNLQFVVTVMKALIVMGGVVLTVSALGALGAVYEGKPGIVLLILYIIYLIIILSMHIFVMEVVREYRESKNSPESITLLPKIPKKVPKLPKKLPTLPELQNTPSLPNVSNAPDPRGPTDAPSESIKKRSIIYDENEGLDAENEDIFDNIVDTTSNFLKTTRNKVQNVIRTGNPRSKKGLNLSIPFHVITNQTETNPEKRHQRTAKWFHNLLPGLSKVFHWIMPTILEPDTNKYVMQLNPLLGPLSKPVLFVSLDKKIFYAGFATVVIEIVCIIISIYLIAIRAVQEPKNEVPTKEREAKKPEKEEERADIPRLI